MGFTIEDMMLVAKDKYKMELIAGENGWSNSISWILMLEDQTICKNFTGKEMAVTTGLGFKSGAKLMKLLKDLAEHNASGIIINTGFYIKEIPDEAIRFCNENDLPLLTVPWDIYLADMIKDLSVRIFLQGSTDEQISEALIHAIKEPDARDLYVTALMPYFDIDGKFQIIMIGADGLDEMDTVERKRMSYRMQLYLTGITHNAHFLYYDGYFLVVCNAVPNKDLTKIVSDFQKKLKQKMKSQRFYLGVGSPVMDVTNLHVAHDRAKSAMRMARDRATKNTSLVYFDDAGVDRLLYSVPDTGLLRQLGSGLLEPLIKHDNEHGSELVATLDQYLQKDGSIKAVAEAMYTHRNTVSYRMNNIRSLLGMDLDSPEDRLMCQIACKVIKMGL